MKNLIEEIVTEAINATVVEFTENQKHDLIFIFTEILTKLKDNKDIGDFLDETLGDL